MLYELSVSTSVKNSPSLITFIPNSCAFFSLDPAPDPATTTSVLLDTLPATLAPCDCNLNFASSRDIPLRVPVSTYVSPFSS